MMPDSKLAAKLDGSDFIITAECSPPAGTSSSVFESCAKSLRGGITAVNVSDNHYGVAMSSLAASTALLNHGLEPVFQMVTRDRNRIALQSDLIGAAFLGIKNVLCLSGYHQTLMGYPEAANVFDIDSVQLIALVKKMNEGSLLNGPKIDEPFSLLIGAVANPYLKPIELNLLRLKKKIDAGARFIQTQAVFDIEGFQRWLEAAAKEGLAGRVAILAGVLPLTGAVQARKLAETYTDFNIPAEVIARLNKAGGGDAGRKEGINIGSEVIKKLKGTPGLRGIHILSGGNESAVPELISASGL
jgi:methylenetetrahydrofolate reductase (NADPH)